MNFLSSNGSLHCNKHTPNANITARIDEAEANAVDCNAAVQPVWSA
eukprot:CAMPEP_0197037060 /NCGR_PEP_ID=MMETSP1384-20130603/14370_1 /TAXON_ID=29189 /ORGANISM="Ammonia sp." /LENGTH=45 /DNA_ID= /DNA_START= /DNA_END= /DNA_ORIENTATION=